MTVVPKDAWAKLSGLSFHYRDWGGQGQPIVLLHGLASTSRIWDMVAPMLAANYAVVALDQRGHGESAKPDTGYDFASVSADLHAFIQHTGLERPVVIGHSWGGDVSLEYAVERPDACRGLGFVDGGSIEISTRPGNTLDKAKEDMAPPDWTGMTVDKLIERARTWRQPTMLTPAHEEILLSNFNVDGNGAISARLSRENHLKIIEALWDHVPSELYPKVRCPVLLMPARQDGVDAQQDRQSRRAESIERAESLIPKSKTVWFEDSVHDVPIQRPELVARAIAEHIDNGFFS